MTAAKARTATLALVGALLLGGCGIKPTGVIEAGHAAEVTVPGATGGVVVYFVAQDSTRLVPVPFFMNGYTLAPTPLVRLLLAGPTGRAREAGLVTELPVVPEEDEEKVVVEITAGDVVNVRLPVKVGGLSKTAVAQIVCTARFSVKADTDTVSDVSITGTDTTLAPTPCDMGR
ncbi:hypothetical protein ACFWUQ_13815 [Streptomyces sp. NPDC058662]|uniref:hypothetical protein n=1 Tax=Streptomyces sp. NPDC058662 TaxID=3346583 RepID=UPI00365E9C8A